jgi:hypothetical protein
VRLDSFYEISKPASISPVIYNVRAEIVKTPSTLCCEKTYPPNPGRPTFLLSWTLTFDLKKYKKLEKMVFFLNRGWNFFFVLWPTSRHFRSLFFAESVTLLGVLCKKFFSRNCKSHRKGVLGAPISDFDPYPWPLPYEPLRSAPTGWVIIYLLPGYRSWVRGQGSTSLDIWGGKILPPLEYFLTRDEFR